MDGVHDVGGMQGFGAACWPGSEEPTHADWELRAFVLALVTGPGSSHAFRHTIERLDPVRYLESTYYERWLYEAEQALVEAGAITHDEVAACRPALRPVTAAAARRSERAAWLCGRCGGGGRSSRRTIRGSRSATACGCGAPDRRGTRAVRAISAARVGRSPACRVSTACRTSTTP